MPIVNFERDLRRTMESTFPDPSTTIGDLYALAQYHLGWRNQALELHDSDGGKKIRPRLCLTACQVAGGDADRAMPMAAAIQLFHEHTLVHDDIQDRSDLRRGRPAVWHLWGEKKAINVGDVLHVLAYCSLNMLSSQGVPADVLLKATHEFNLASLKVAEGQQLDLLFEDRLDLNEADYLAMIERKTATLIAASASLGAIVGGGSPELIRALFSYGLNLGLAFQVQDDILGIWGRPEHTGKPFAIDLYGRKKSLPVLYALAHSQDKQKRALQAIYSQASLSKHEVETVLSILDDSSDHAYSEEAASKYYHMALTALDDISNVDQEALLELRGILNELLSRDR